MVAAAKLLVLNPGEFELWKMRIEQYFLMTDYALWEVIINGDSPPPKRTVDGVERTYPSTAAEIVILKERVKKLENKRRSRTYKSRRLYMVGLSKRIESSDDASLGAQEDASKQRRKIADIDQDAKEVEVEKVEKVVSTADPITTAGEVVTTTSVEIPEELTLAQTLIEIKSAKPKAVTTATTTTTITRPKARGVVVQEPSEFTTTTSPSQASQLPHAKDKAQLQAELEEKERLSRQKEEEANIALIESWDNTQAMMDADFQLAQQMQTKEQEQLSIKEKSKLFLELLEKRKKHFAALRAK
ncbi:hypothetical protein Tco_0211130 [Tanacetum coccineum]